MPKEWKHRVDAVKCKQGESKSRKNQCAKLGMEALGEVGNVNHERAEHAMG